MNSRSTSDETWPTWCTVCEDKRVTQLQPHPMCDSCWADRYSTQSLGGVVRPYKEILKEQLIESGLWFKDGETRGEWQERISLEGRGALRRFTGREKVKVGVHKEPTGDGSGSAGGV